MTKEQLEQLQFSFDQSAEDPNLFYRVCDWNKDGVTHRIKSWVYKKDDTWVFEQTYTTHQTTTYMYDDLDELIRVHP